MSSKETQIVAELQTMNKALAWIFVVLCIGFAIGLGFLGLLVSVVII